MFVADLFTKAVTGAKFKYLRTKLRVWSDKDEVIEVEARRSMSRSAEISTAGVEGYRLGINMITCLALG